MVKSGLHIVTTQNEDSHIDELIAQKELYTKAKRLQIALFLITIPSPILMSVLLMSKKGHVEDTAWIFALYIIFAAIFGQILEYSIIRYKKIAASIQEEFDLSVLSIPKNTALRLTAIDKETIRRFSRGPKQKEKNRKAVLNWYSINISEIDSNVSSLLCQRTNVYYDFSVRNRYSLVMILFVAFTFLSLLIISLLNSLDISSFLVEVIMPSIPIFLFTHKEIQANKESIANLNDLKVLIENNLQNLNKTDTIEQDSLRRIQDRIFQNRILSPLIPNWIYFILRPKLEDEMNYSVNDKIESLELD